MLSTAKETPLHREQVRSRTLLHDYFPAVLASLIDEMTIITPQIAFSSTEGFILDDDGHLVTEFGWVLNHITQIDYTASVLKILDTEANCRIINKDGDTIMTTHDIIQVVGQYCLHNNGTVTIFTPDRVSLVPLDKHIVQIAPYYRRLMILSSNYEVSLITDDKYAQLELFEVVVKLYPNVVELLDGSLISVNLFGNMPTKHIKRYGSVGLDTNQTLYRKTIDYYLIQEKIISTNVLDFVGTDGFLAILQTNGDVTIKGNHPFKRLFP